MSVRASDLLVVGGGAGGLVLALVLAKKGFRVSILDRQDPPVPAARGEILQPNGLKILDGIGILSDLLSSDVYRCDRVRFYQGGGQHLCTIDYNRLQSPYNYALILLPDVLQRLLLKRLESESNIQTFWGTSFKDVIRDGDRVVGLSADHCGQALSFRAPLLVGADGIGSRVRTAFGLQHQVHSYADGYVTMVIERPPGFQSDVHYYLGKEMIFGAFPVSKDRIYLFYLVPTRRLESTRNQGIDVLKREILSLNPEVKTLFSGPLKQVLSWEQCAYMPCFRVTSKRWVVNGGALLGDAAHAMNPHVAQGRNAAMEDALALANTIEDCFKQDDFSEARLSAYETARRAKVASLQKMGHEMAWLWNSGFPPLVWARDRVFKSLHQHPPLHDKMLNTVAGLNISALNLADRCRALFS